MRDQQTSETNLFLRALPNLDSLFQQTWNELQNSAAHPEHPWGLGVLSTIREINGSHSPEVRTLVLRGAEKEARTLTWHTDRRSAKVEQLQKNENTSILFWSPVDRVQLVVRGMTKVLTSGSFFAEEWGFSKPTSRRAYLGEKAPGESAEQMTVNFPDMFTHRPPTEEESEFGLKNFAVLQTIVGEMDLLTLRQVGNVRAKFKWNAESTKWNSSWICP